MSLSFTPAYHDSMGVPGASHSGELQSGIESSAYVLQTSSPCSGRGPSPTLGEVTWFLYFAFIRFFYSSFRPATHLGQIRLGSHY